MANRTEGSGLRAPTRWVADVAVRLEPHVHAVQRARRLRPGLQLPSRRPGALPAWCRIRWPRTVPRWPWSMAACMRADKQWPRTHWLELGRMLNAQGFRVALVHGNGRSASPAKPWHRPCPMPRFGLPWSLIGSSIIWQVARAWSGWTAASATSRGAGCSPSAATTSIPHGAPARRPWAHASADQRVRHAAPDHRRRLARVGRNAGGAAVIRSGSQPAHGLAAALVPLRPATRVLRPSRSTPRPSKSALGVMARRFPVQCRRDMCGPCTGSLGDAGVLPVMAQLRQALPGMRLLLTHRHGHWAYARPEPAAPRGRCTSRTRSPGIRPARWRVSDASFALRIGFGRTEVWPTWSTDATRPVYRCAW